MRAGSLIRSMLLVVVVVVPASLAPTRAAAESCADELGESRQSRCARALYGSGNFAEAADAFAMLWQRRQAAKYLYNEAVAREAAGSAAWALLLLEKYLLERGLTDAERDDAAKRSKQLRARVHTVDVTIVPAGALGKTAQVFLEREHDGWTEKFSMPLWKVIHGPGIRLHLDRGLWVLWIDPASRVAAYNVGGKAHLTSIQVAGDTSTRLELRPSTADLLFTMGPASELRRGVVLTLRDPEGIEEEHVDPVHAGEHKMSLRTGTWHYRVRPRKLVAETRSGEVVVKSDAVVALRWDPSPEVVSQRKHQRKLWLGLAGASVGAAAIGAGLLGAYARKPTLTCYDGFLNTATPVDTCDPGQTDANNRPIGALYYNLNDVEVQWQLAAWGGGFVGGAVGLGAAAGLETLPPKRTRVSVTMGVGAVVAVAGVVTHAVVGAAYLGQKSPRWDLVDGSYIEAGGSAGTIGAGSLTAGMVGLGIGLLLGSGSAALARHLRGRNQRARVTPGAGPGALGVGVVGLF